MSNALFDTRSGRFYYWTLPVIVLVPQIIMYFSGVRWAVEIVCPSINREFGTIENLQLITLLFMAGTSFWAAAKKQNTLERIGFALLGVFSVLVFFEEMDWGAHYAELWYGNKSTVFSDIVGQTNIHNQGDNAKWFKRPVYLIMAALFIFLPYFKEKLGHPIFQYLTPKKLIVGTVIIALLSDLIPRFIVKWGILPDAGLGVNIGEFSEIMVYYTFALYVFEIATEKTLTFPLFKKGTA